MAEIKKIFRFYANEDLSFALLWKKERMSASNRVKAIGVVILDLEKMLGYEMAKRDRRIVPKSERQLLKAIFGKVKI